MTKQRSQSENPLEPRPSPLSLMLGFPLLLRSTLKSRQWLRSGVVKERRLVAYPGHQRCAGGGNVCVSAAQGSHLPLLAPWQLERGSFGGLSLVPGGRAAAPSCLQRRETQWRG